MSLFDLPLFAHRPQAIHANSTAALHSEHPKLSKRAEAILAEIKAHGPGTDREIACRMGFGNDLNTVRPRISELVEAHSLREIKQSPCRITGKTVRTVGI